MGIALRIGSLALGSSSLSRSWTPQIPTGVTLTVVSDTVIKVDWTNIDTSGDGAKVYISTDNITFTLKTAVALGVATANATGLTKDTLYYFYVVFYKGSKESDPSTVNSGRTLITTPADVTGLDLWLNANDIAGNDGDLISSWISSEGSSYSFDAATTKRPTLKKGANGINSQNAVSFNGIANILRYNGALLNTTKGTIIIIFKCSDTVGTGGMDLLASADEATAGTYYFAFRASNAASPNSLPGIYQRSNDTASNMFGRAQTVPFQAGRMVYKSDGSTYSMKLDNNWLTLSGTGSNNGDWFGDTANRDNITIGGVKITAEMTFFKGLIAEIISYNTDLSTDNLTKVENYLTNKYGDLSQQMAVMGDSITAGVGVSDEAHRWANLIATNKGWRLHNAGWSGTMLQNTVQNTVATIGAAQQYNGRDAYIERLLAYKGAKLFILYGLNDLRLNDVAITVNLYQNDLGEIVDGLIAGGVSVTDIIIGSPSYMNPANYVDGAPWNAGSTVKHEAYRDAAAAVAAAKGTKYKDIYQYMLDNGSTTLMIADGIHPNDAGHAAIATAFLSVL